MKNKTLVLMTEGFPYGRSEAFLETEIIYLSQVFEKIIICVSTLPSDLESRILPNNCAVKIFNSKSTSHFRKLVNIFNPTYLQELFNISFKLGKRITVYKMKVALQYLNESKSIAKKLKSLENSNTLFYSYWSDKNALAMTFLNKATKKIARCHRWDLYFESQPEDYLPYRNLLIRNLDKIYPISQDGKDEIINKWGVKNPKNIEVARLGVKPQALAFDFNKKLIVSCSNLIKVKRIELLIETLSKVQSSINWVHFGDGRDREKLENQARESLPKNVNYHFYGSIGNSELLEFYKTEKVSLFINVSESEGIPVSIMEAASFGIPIMATDVGGTKELVNNKNGVLLNKNFTTESLALEIEKFFALEQIEVQKISLKAHLTWELNYNAEKNYSEFANKLLNL